MKKTIKSKQLILNEHLNGVEIGNSNQAILNAMEEYRTQELNMQIVSQQRELLLAYHRFLVNELSLDIHEVWVNEYLKANNCG